MAHKKLILARNDPASLRISLSDTPSTESFRFPIWAFFSFFSRFTRHDALVIKKILQLATVKNSYFLAWCIAIEWIILRINLFIIILNNFNHEIPYFVKIIFWNENIITSRRLNNWNNAIRTNQCNTLAIWNDPLREPLNPKLWLVNMDIIWSIKKRLKSHLSPIDTHTGRYKNGPCDMGHILNFYE